MPAPMTAILSLSSPMVVVLLLSMHVATRRLSTKYAGAKRMDSSFDYKQAIKMQGGEITTENQPNLQ
jgi:hypothetical protein